jgi:hypothetical protein
MLSLLVYISSAISSSFLPCSLIKISVYNVYIGGQDSMLGIAGHFWLDSPGIELCWGWDFLCHPNHPWVPPSLLDNGYQDFLRATAVWVWCWPPTSFYCYVENWLELYDILPFLLHSHVLGWSVPLLFTVPVGGNPTFDDVFLIDATTCFEFWSAQPLSSKSPYSIHSSSSSWSSLQILSYVIFPFDLRSSYWSRGKWLPFIDFCDFFFLWHPFHMA